MSSATIPTIPDHVSAEAVQLGLAALMLVETERRTFSISALVAWLATPIRLNQAMFLFTPDGHPIGFATWAYLDEETAARIRNGEVDLLSPEDWNDGEQLWIIDMVAPFGDVRKLARALRERLSQTHSRFEFVRERAGKRRVVTGRVQSRQVADRTGA